MTSLSDRLGAGVYFNPKVQMPHGVRTKSLHLTQYTA
jgi:hypothetical protein